VIFLIEGFKNKISSFIANADSNMVEKFTIGFYQLLNREQTSTYESKVLDIQEVLDFLKNVSTIENEVKQTTPTEEIAFFLTHVAHMYASLMMLERAVPFYRASINIRENYLEVKSLATAENYQSIGAVYEQGGLFDKALVCYKKSLTIRKELSYVDNNLLVAESYSRLALAYYHLEYYAIALDYIEDTIRIRERLLPSGHTLLENSYYNYRYIKKASEPRKDYLSLFADTVGDFKRAIISRLVTFK
jgi:tetratricopeptide (TPR) repeat protein